MTTTAERTPRVAHPRDADLPHGRLRVLPRSREGTTTLPGASHITASHRDYDQMEASFTVAERGEGQAVPLEDARRVGGMRRLARARLAFCGLPHLADTVELIVSELVTNAILHGRGGTVSLSMELRDGYLRVAIQNGTPVQSAIRPAVQIVGDDAEHGRGLHLVEWCTVMHGGSWGVSDGGTTVWCELPAKGEDQ